MKDNREHWNLINLTSRTITSGFPFVRAIGPGKSTDLLASVTKDQVRQSKGIALLLNRGWARIDVIVDDQLVRAISASNIDDLNDTTLSVALDDGSGNVDFQGNTINLNDGTGQAGGNLNLDGGTIVFNNEASLSGAGDVLSANCSELTTAADLTVYGDLAVMGATILSLPDAVADGEPKLIDNGTFVVYEDGNDLVLKARNKDGKELKVELGKFK